MQRIKSSKYNMLIPHPNGGQLLYNTLSGQGMRLTENVVQKYRAFAETEFLREDAPVELGALQVQGFFIPSDYEEWRVVEYKYMQTALDPDELHIEIVPTNACNFDCIYCYQEHRHDFMDEQAKERILKFIQNKLKRNHKKLFISWYGGEPLLAKSMVVEMSERIFSICREEKVALYGHMTTNGYGLGIDTFRKLADANMLCYDITIDGIAEMHNRQRPSASGKPTYEIIMSNLDEIHRSVQMRGIRINVRTNITPTSIGSFYEFAKQFVGRFGTDPRFFLVPEPVQDWKGSRIEEHRGDVMGDKAQVFALYRWLKENGIRVSSHLDFRRTHTCAAASKNGYVIDWNGEVHKCDIALYDDALKDVNHIGTLDNLGNLLLNEENEMRWVVRDIANKSCTDCTLYPMCMGTHCLLSTNFNADHVCRIYDDFYQYVASSAMLMGLDTK